MDWKPTIDAGLECGPYEVYGRDDRRCNLLYKGESIAVCQNMTHATEAAQAHQRHLPNRLQEPVM